MKNIIFTKALVQRSLILRKLHFNCQPHNLPVTNSRHCNQITNTDMYLVMMHSGNETN